jgi:hypothetical protein
MGRLNRYSERIARNDPVHVRNEIDQALRTRIMLDPVVSMLHAIRSENERRIERRSRRNEF